ncbi:hypothetical protein BDD12DRAFT_876727 [Trichophaea hybrida]|nr:hypothetical protein BDD12DRAFT_876727 [Trichophaea hybrida]
MSSTPSSYITGSHNRTNTGNTTTTSSNNAIDNSHTYQQYIYNVGGNNSQATHVRQLRHDKILEMIGPQTEKSVFLGLLPPMTNQDEHISTVNPDDPKLYWIFQDIDFKDWLEGFHTIGEATDSSQVLWIFGPPNRGITEVASHIVGLTKGNASGAGFYFFCSMLERETSVATTFTTSVLHHILNSSGDNQARSIVTTFLSTLLHIILERNHWHFREEDSSAITVEKILNASFGGELLRALTEAVVKIETIPDTPLIIDGIDKLGKEGAQFLQRFCSQAIISPKFKALLTCRPDPHIKEIVDGVLCIEYDKERQECLNSLLHDDTRYDKIEKEHRGSLKWLWTHEQYRKWTSSERSSLLYIEGKPGSGKSTLAKYFRENLAEKEPNTGSSIIANYFYTLRGTTLEPTHENMLRSVLYSILKQDETLPTELDVFYRDILRELEKREEPDIKDGLRMFRFVLFTYRPLRLAELRHALAIPDDPDAEFLTSKESFEEDLIHGIDKRVVHCGGNFLEIKGLDEDRSVQFMHHTLGNGLPGVDSWTPKHFEAYAEYLNKRPFINYALSHLTQHIESCRQRANFEQLVSLLCEQLSNNPACLLLESWVESHLHQNISTPEKGFANDFRIELLHAATRMKYSHVVEAVLATGADKEACLDDKTPLMVSAESGDEATARVLLDQEARIGAKDKNKQTALHFAAAKAHDQMIKLLFHRGADTEAMDGEGRTPLHHAASNGHNTTLQMLIKTLSVDKEVTDYYGRTALHHAASNGHDTTLRILIETLSVDKEVTDGEGRTDCTMLHPMATTPYWRRVHM